MLSLSLVLAIVVQVTESRPSPNGKNPWYPGTFSAGARYGPDLDKCDYTKYRDSGCSNSPQRLCALDPGLDPDVIAQDQEADDGLGGCPNNNQYTPGFNSSDPTRNNASGLHNKDFGCYCLHKQLFPMTELDVGSTGIFMCGAILFHAYTPFCKYLCSWSRPTMLAQESLLLHLLASVEVGSTCRSSSCSSSSSSQRPDPKP